MFIEGQTKLILELHTVYVDLTDTLFMVIHGKSLSMENGINRYDQCPNLYISMWTPHFELRLFAKLIYWHNLPINIESHTVLIYSLQCEWSQSKLILSKTHTNSTYSPTVHKRLSQRTNSFADCGQIPLWAQWLRIEFIIRHTCFLKNWFINLCRHT